jgi:hypothetical protein
MYYPPSSQFGNPPSGQFYRPTIIPVHTPYLGSFPSDSYQYVTPHRLDTPMIEPNNYSFASMSHHQVPVSTKTRFGEFSNPNLQLLPEMGYETNQAIQPSLSNPWGNGMGPDPDTNTNAVCHRQQYPSPQGVPNSGYMNGEEDIASDSYLPNFMNEINTMAEHISTTKEDSQTRTTSNITNLSRLAI